jgi:hypothetical protein
MGIYNTIYFDFHIIAIPEGKEEKPAVNMILMWLQDLASRCEGMTESESIW